MPSRWEIRWQLEASCSSTQERARSLCSALPSHAALCVLAHVQSAGKGQWGRGWVSLPGNLHLTVALQAFPQMEGWVSRAAHAIVQWMAPLGIEAERRGYNDLVVDSAKLAGFLLERWELPTGSYVGLGLGMNLVQTPQLLERPQPATSLHQLGVDLSPLTVAGHLVPLLLRAIA